VFSAGAQGCGFLDEELLTEEGIFGSGGLGMHGTGRSGCGGGRGIYRASVSPNVHRTDEIEEFDEVGSQEFDMEEMNFRALSRVHHSVQSGQRLKNKPQDPVIDLFVAAENQVDSAWRTSERGGVH